MLSRTKLTVLVVVAGLVLAAAATALAAEGDAGRVKRGVAGSDLLERSNVHLEEAVRVQKLRQEYRDAYRRAEAAGLAPQRSALPRAGERQLRAGVERLTKRIREAEEAATVAGVPRETLEAIAACESGGDPTAIGDGGAYRGKYQFDTGTWASVGGSGDPAAAPEAEQDRRAALLYKRSGPSPWPVCAG